MVSDQYVFSYKNANKNSPELEENSLLEFEAMKHYSNFYEKEKTFLTRLSESEGGLVVQSWKSRNDGSQQRRQRGGTGGQ